MINPLYSRSRQTHQYVDRLPQLLPMTKHNHLKLITLKTLPYCGFQKVKNKDCEFVQQQIYDTQLIMILVLIVLIFKALSYGT